MAGIHRNIDRLELALTATEGTSPEICYKGFGGGRVYFAAGATGTLNWYSADDKGGTYGIAYNEAGTAIQSVVQGGASSPIPSELFGALWLKGVMSAGTADVVISLIV